MSLFNSNFKPIITPAQLSPRTDLQNSTPYGYSTTLASGQLGIPVTSWISFLRNAGPPTEDNIILTIAECLITVSQKPKVIKTYSVGKDYSVKTYIGKEDYEIEIEGYLFNIKADGSSSAGIEGIYPADRMNTLQTILGNQGQNLGINVFSPVLELFGDVVGRYVSGINSIVVTNSEFPQEEGMYSQQKFTISAVSDSLSDSDIIYSPYIP